MLTWCHLTWFSDATSFHLCLHVMRGDGWGGQSYPHTDLAKRWVKKRTLFCEWSRRYLVSKPTVPPPAKLSLHLLYTSDWFELGCVEFHTQAFVCEFLGLIVHNRSRCLKSDLFINIPHDHLGDRVIGWSVRWVVWCQIWDNIPRQKLIRTYVDIGSFHLVSIRLSIWNLIWLMAC